MSIHQVKMLAVGVQFEKKKKKKLPLLNQNGLKLASISCFTFCNLKCLLF